MLPTNRRVRKESFDKIIKEGIFVHGNSLYLRLLSISLIKSTKSSENTILPSRFGFVVPNKVEKTSVGRHLIKRRLTAIVEKLLITIKPGFSVIVFVKKDILPLSFAEVEKEMAELLKKAKMLNEK